MKTEILNEINNDNILNILDNKTFNKIYENDEEYIIYNIISLRDESNEFRKNGNIEYANKIDEFLKTNINEFKNINTNIFLRSPFFETQIEKEMNNELNEFEEYEDSVEICKKCNTKNTKYTGDKQTRSSDEGMTSFFVCINDNCPYYIEYNKRWIFWK
jgi:DNA-directed RNA polymerase subunit M/transcription elongation factor TFIIS